MANDDRELKQRVERLESELAAVKSRQIPIRCVRKRSKMTIFGLPLWHIARGPDVERGERMGHARGIIAIGDEALGMFAVGGIARGLFALGGVAFGGFTLGGVSIGLLLAAGGATIGGIAVGGAAVGVVAIGGAALGYFATGGAACGEYTINALHQDPAAVDLLKRIIGF
jgi:hypothetical protein